MTTAVNDNQAKWQDFHEANPGVYRLIKHFTFQAIDAGLEHYGMQSVLERVRWHTDMATRNNDGFKINNNHAPFYARLFMNDYPQHAGFFRTRKQQGVAA